MEPLVPYDEFTKIVGEKMNIVVDRYLYAKMDRLWHEVTWIESPYSDERGQGYSQCSCNKIKDIGVDIKYHQNIPLNSEPGFFILWRWFNKLPYTGPGSQTAFWNFTLCNFMLCPKGIMNGNMMDYIEPVAFRTAIYKFLISMEKDEGLL
jgi:hypothetical protein